MHDLRHAEWDLQALCQVAGVTERTVRYYIQRGLLPSPGAGRGTRYHRGYLDRLRLIREMQRRFLPLEEIRQQMQSMSDDAVGRALSTGGGAAPNSAADYLASVLGNAMSSGPIRPPRPVTPAEGESRPQASIAQGPALGAVEVQSIGSGKLQQSNWERYELGEGIELHARRPASREQQRRVERILAAAARILNE